MSFNMSFNFPRKTSLVVIGSLVLLAGCGKSGETAKTQTQVAAKVNQDEISVHQINSVLARTPGIQAEQAKQASQQILEKLIDQQLLVAQAQEQKLDRNPAVLEQIEGSRREILARAYLEQLGGGANKPSAEEVREYFKKHPELFSERRIYNFNEVSMPSSDGLLSELQAQMSKVKSIADVVEWLKQKNIPVNAATTTKPAEQLPIELLPKLHQMKDGQIGVLPVPGRIVVMQLAASRTVPISEANAIPMIEQYLLNQRKVELISKEMKSLREKAKIEYQGEFTAPAAAPATPPVAATTPAPTAVASPAVKTPDQAVIEKGLSSIK